MQLASSLAFPEPLLAAMWQLSENSRLGFRLAGNTLHQGFGAGKYLIGIGDTASVVQYAWLESLMAQQTYGRQPDGSYKADPADVQKAIDDKKPIHEPGNPDKSSQCVFACKVLSRMKNINTSQWSKGGPALELNDTTDIGLAIATLGSGRYPADGDRNSGIYMGHDGNGAIKIVDQWPDNGPNYDHPREHTLPSNGQPSMNATAYFVIIVKNP